MEKPNFERIASAYEKPQNALQSISDFWESIKDKGGLPQMPQLEALLEEYNLQALSEDFRLMGIYFQALKNAKSGGIERINRLYNTDREIIQALKLFKSGEGLKIEIKSLVRNESASIIDKQLIGLIEKSLIDFFMLKQKLLISHMFENIPPIDIQEMLNNAISSDSIPSKKGRKQKHLIGHELFIMQRYLQKNTAIKAKGESISNEQSRFVFSFFQIFGLLEDSELMKWKEDNIRHQLNIFKTKYKNRN